MTMCCFSLSVLFDEGFWVQLNASSLVLMPETVLRITWLPETVVPAVDPDSYTVAITSTANQTHLRKWQQ